MLLRWPPALIHNSWAAVAAPAVAVQVPAAARFWMANLSTSFTVSPQRAYCLRQSSGSEVRSCCHPVLRCAAAASCGARELVELDSAKLPDWRPGVMLGQIPALRARCVFLINRASAAAGCTTPRWGRAAAPHPTVSLSFCHLTCFIALQARSLATTPKRRTRATAAARTWRCASPAAATSCWA